MAFHLADVMALLLAGRFEAMVGDISPTAAFDDERRGQQSVIRFQMEMLLTARQLQPVVDIIRHVCIVRLASASPLASRGVIVVVFQVTAHHLAAVRHFARHDHLVVS